MSVRITGQVWAHSRATGTALLLHLALADHADDSERACWPSLRLLAEKTRTSRDTVRRAVRELESLGEVTLERRGSGRQSARYVLRGYADCDLRGSNLQPLDAPGEVADCDLRDGNLPTSEVAPLLPEPSKNRQRTTHAPAEGVLHLADFAHLWELYPRKVNRKRAERAYLARRRGGVSAEELLTATRHYAAARSGKDATYTLHPATFFGPDERWRDFLTAEARAEVRYPDTDPTSATCEVRYA